MLTFHALSFDSRLESMMPFSTRRVQLLRSPELVEASVLQLTILCRKENIIEMNNSCICCTVRGDLIAGLKKLHKQTTGKAWEI